MKKEIKHDCPTDMVYSNKKGKCINPRLEDESLSENSKDVPTKSLRFPNKTLGFPLAGKRKEKD